MRRKMEDERDWIQGQYFFSALATVMSNAFSKNSHAEYVKQPLLKDAFDTEHSDDEERNERLAAAEFEAFIHEMKRQGLPDTNTNLTTKG